ncbi:MAG: HNH endonuclease [Gammaproteobacteria bacterium]
MKTKRISKQKFIFSAEYREGVNDALDEILAIQKELLEENPTRENCEKIYDEVVNSVYDDLAEYAVSQSDEQNLWNIIYRIVYRVYKRSIEKLNFIKSMQRQLNQELIEKNLRNGIEAGIRLKVMKRDCFKCRYCGESPSTDPKITLVVDHIQPLTKGGKNCLDNYQTLCNFCNAGKSNIY